MFTGKRNIIILILLTALSLITLRQFSDHVKLAVGFCLASITAVTLNQWSAIITILWGVLQIGLLIPNYYAMIFKKKNGA